MRVCVVGGGLAGMAAAVRLAAEGHDVSLLEQNSHLGGKMNVWRSEGFTFDMGPTIITMPSVLERLFSSVGRRAEDYLNLVSLDPQWRTFFADGSRFDLYTSLEGMVAELRRFAPEETANYLRFLAYAHRMYDVSERWFFWKPWGSLREAMREGGLSAGSLSLAASIDPLTTMHQAIRRHFQDPRLAQLFEHFVQYVGSSPFIAPAILTLIAWVQVGLGCWYPMGGTGEIAAALTRLCAEFNVDVHTDTPVERIETVGDRVSGVIAQNGRRFAADAVVCNSDIVLTLTGLLETPEAVDHYRKNAANLEPACSGAVLYLGCNRRFPNLLHHDFFFSTDSDAEFRDIYENRIPHADPTIYLAVPSRTDPSVAPEGCEAIYALVHTPYVSDGYDWSSRAREYRDIIVRKLEKWGLEGLEESIVTERMLTPLDIRDMYRANKGAIYGVVTKRGLTSAFKTGNRSKLYRGLYHAGGSVNPGAGVPMVLMSGQIAAQCVLDDAKSGALEAPQAAAAASR